MNVMSTLFGRIQGRPRKRRQPVTDGCAFPKLTRVRLNSTCVVVTMVGKPRKRLSLGEKHQYVHFGKPRLPSRTFSLGILRLLLRHLPLFGLVPSQNGSCYTYPGLRVLQRPGSLALRYAGSS
ncbi:hypothetical protein NCU03427 [Neurospora crassa OR74A]|uniref:Uncharacterized protein n=1 Tax=Neurospora crassa (strain ATCC 24698 / 74-OR23-1A / CBS 708.71 / DSM 1257 / FGSC 987) TaxID=367110 RepID=Q7RXU4_NEUCR|nr:hypothetical protein NCU03427 [Neurospora crassa OR74A]EAA27477.2 hypothetical protein NCU03427 [Neurospora crassa OR74A]|eukprot:XP_956713.2 hypothetical protein NCU03427 [Neurospora crassa OR74A]